MEIWKEIVVDSNNTKYEISNFGNVRNIETGKLICGHTDKNGYVRINIYYHGKRYTKSIHRLVAKAFIPNPNDLPQVDHIDGNKSNNNLSNLRWVTASENIRAAFSNGLKTQYGENNPANKYSEKEIINASLLLQSGNYTCREVSDITGLTFETIGHISRKERWKNVTENFDFSRIKREYTDHSEITTSVDRAIVSGKSRKEIIKTLIDYGLTRNRATNLYKRRRESVASGKSLVNYTVYIDEGIEIF